MYYANNLILDFGLVVLAWLVQLVIYPSFLRAQQSTFVAWHTSYTKRITVIVAPLMLGQLAFSVYWLVVTKTSLNAVIYLLLVLATWLVTFMQAIPLHNQLNNGFNEAVIRKLIQVNWVRTVIWTLAFLFLFFFHPFGDLVM